MLAELRECIVATPSYHKSVATEESPLAGFILNDVAVSLCAIEGLGEPGEETHNVAIGRECVRAVGSVRLSSG
jgi:hypothetical protein